MMYSAGGVLLTQTEDVLGWWKQYFEDLLNPSDTSSVESAESETRGTIHPLPGDEATKTTKLLLGGRASGTDEIHYCLTSV